MDPPHPTMDWYGGGGVKAQVNRGRHMFVLRAETQWEGRHVESTDKRWGVGGIVQECVGRFSSGWDHGGLMMMPAASSPSSSSPARHETPPPAVMSLYMPIRMLWMIWKIAAETKRWKCETLHSCNRNEASLLISGLCRLTFSFSNRVRPLFTKWALSGLSMLRLPPGELSDTVTLGLFDMNCASPWLKVCYQVGQFLTTFKLPSAPDPHSLRD